MCVVVTDMVQRKTLVLDLDETLIHSHHDGVLRQTVKPGTPPDFVLKVCLLRRMAAVVANHFGSPGRAISPVCVFVYLNLQLIFWMDEALQPRKKYGMFVFWRCCRFTLHVQEVYTRNSSRDEIANVNFLWQHLYAFYAVLPESYQMWWNNAK